MKQRHFRTHIKPDAKQMADAAIDIHSTASGQVEFASDLLPSNQDSLLFTYQPYTDIWLLAIPQTG
jgi:hypothetical protein